MVRKSCQKHTTINTLCIAILVFSATSCNTRMENNVDMILDTALRTAQKMEDGWQKDIVLGLVAAQYAKAGQYDKALHIVEAIEEEQDVALMTIAAALSEIGEGNKAITAAEMVKDTVFRDIALCDVAEGYANSQQYIRSHEVIQTIQNPISRSHTLVEMAATYSQDGRNEEAYDILGEALHIVRTEADTSSSIFVLTKIAGGYIQTGYQRDALTVLLYASQLAETMQDAYHKCHALTRVAYRYWDADSQEKARQTLDHAFDLASAIDDTSQANRALGTIAATYFLIGESERALNMVREKGDYLILAWIAGKCSQDGEYDRATALLSDAYQMANAEDTTYSRCLALAGVVRQFQERGQSEKSFEKLKEILSEAYEVAMRVDDYYWRNLCLNMIAWSYTAMGNTEKALHVANTIDNPFQKVMALTNIADKLTEPSTERTVESECDE